MASLLFLPQRPCIVSLPAATCYVFCSGHSICVTNCRPFLLLLAAGAIFLSPSGRPAATAERPLLHFPAATTAPSAATAALRQQPVTPSFPLFAHRSFHPRPLSIPSPPPCSATCHHPSHLSSVLPFFSLEPVPVPPLTPAHISHAVFFFPATCCLPPPCIQPSHNTSLHFLLPETSPVLLSHGPARLY